MSIGAWLLLGVTGAGITAIAGHTLGAVMATILACGYVAGAAVMWATGGAR